MNWDDYCKSECISTLKEFPVNIAPADWDDASQQMPVLTYVAGYCCHSVSKKLRCETCKNKITSQVGDVQSIENALISRITRGGLLYPSPDAVHIVVANFIIVNKLAETKAFRFAPAQRQLVVNATMSALDEEDFLWFYEDTCENNHELLHVTNMLVWICTNILLNNLCFKHNDLLVQEKQAKKRKLQTLA